jgi:hypothetical protein
MTTPRNTPEPVFPRSLTWLGIVILGSALTSLTIPEAVASGSALNSSTIEWPSVNLNDGVLSGGTPHVFSSGMRGWGDAPFSALGPMGLEWQTPFELARREVYSGSASSIALTPGGASLWTSGGLLFPRPDDVVDTTSTIRVEANQAQWNIRLFSGAEDTMSAFRFFWTAGLVSSYAPEYSSPAPGVIVINDSSGQHPTLVLRATSTAGVVQWGGSGIYTAPLNSGEREPTLYVHSTGAQDITVVISVGIVDSDPCARAEAITFASENASAPATAWPALTRCMASPSWAATAGEETTLSVALASALPDYVEGQSRTLSIEGLPPGVSWQRMADTENGLAVQLSAASDVSPGDYPVSLSAHTATTLGGVTQKSEPLSATGVLTIAPAVIVEPEPEPEPMPEPEEPPAPAEEDDAEPVVEPAVEPDTEETVASAPQPESSGDSRTIRVSPPSEEPVVILPRVRLATPSPELPEPDVESFAVARPEEIPLVSPPPAAPVPASAEAPPEPIAASAWLGLSLLASLALGGLIAALRRRREQPVE